MASGDDEMNVKKNEVTIETEKEVEISIDEDHDAIQATTISDDNVENNNDDAGNESLFHESSSMPPQKKQKIPQLHSKECYKPTAGGQISASLPVEYQEIFAKYKDLIRMAQEEDPSCASDPNTQEEMLQIIKRWDPQTDIICLYVRWARQLPKNFHLDSIATLLCLSNQCGYTPIDFLTTVKTLQAIPSKNEYGFSINYDSFGKLDSKGQQLNQQFKGLSLTLALLQANVTRSNGLLGKTKMREKPGTRGPVTMQVSTGNEKLPSKVSFTATPQIEFHTVKALATRMWRSVNHRWMALYVVEHLFRPMGNKVWNKQTALEFSFQMFSGFGRTRYDYLDPLAGVSLYFVSQDHDIEPNRQKLDKVWANALLFVPFANSFLNSINDMEKVRIIVEAFHLLDLKTQKRYSYQPHQSFEKRWLLLRCFIFQQWLSRSKHTEFKSLIESELKQRKKYEPKTTKQTQSSVPEPIKLAPYSTATLQVPPPVTPVTAKNQPCNGLQELVSSQTRNSHCLRSMKVTNHRDEMSSDEPHNNMIRTSETTLMDYGKKFSEKTEWSTASLLHPAVMDQLCASYLLIHREDGIDVVARLTPLEIYSADLLCNRKHGRFSGDASYYPSSHVGPVSLNVSTNVKSFLDITSKGSYQVARIGSSYLNQHGPLLPNLEECGAICRAVLRYGKQDAYRSSGQFRINIGCGGQDRRDGIPCKLHDGGFKVAISQDPQYNDINLPHLIGRCVEVIWKVLSDMLHDSDCSPMALDPHRDNEYARHLRDYLCIVYQVGFEDVTVVVSSLYPSVDRVNLHLDQMNDNVSGYTRTGTLNICFGLGEPVTNIVHLQVRKLVCQHQYSSILTDSIFRSLLTLEKLFENMWFHSCQH